jgi:hypothetical protein
MRSVAFVIWLIARQLFQNILPSWQGTGQIMICAFSTGKLSQLCQ